MSANRKDKQQLLVWGYIKEIGELYQINNIPLEINEMIYLYHKIMHDEWSKKYSCIDTIIKNNDVKITSNLNGTVFGEAVIDKGVFKWVIKIKSICYNDIFAMSPYIGIVDNNALIRNEVFTDSTNWHDYGYQLNAQNGNMSSWGFDIDATLHNRGGIMHRTNPNMPSFGSEMFGGSSMNNPYALPGRLRAGPIEPIFGPVILKKTEEGVCIWNKQGEILEMALNLNEKTLIFKVDDKDKDNCLTLSHIKKRRYRLAFGFVGIKGSHFKLLSAEFDNDGD